MIQDLLIQTSWQEWLGVFFSMLQVVLASRNNSLNYLFGIAGVLLTLYVMAYSGLYAEFTLNLYYLVMSIYGWIYWLRGKASTQIPITKSSDKDWILSVSIVLISFILFLFALTQFTDSDVPVADALVSAFAWAGMWLMARRKLENWLLLNVSNLIAVPLMIHKELYLYAILSVFLFVVAVIGYFNWRHIMKQQKMMLNACFRYQKFK
ncbi:MAG: nicotinamide riboside transporter PnuC [Sphingobacteriales bacterium]|nr:MAG: nicotinamide riboside transporter PnuC [Sphingobacteriales bacterium]